MGRVPHLPIRGDVFVDARDGGRTMRISQHHEHGVFVVSLWRGNDCVASFQLDEADVPGLVGVLVEGLADVRAPAIRAAV